VNTRRRLPLAAIVAFSIFVPAGPATAATGGGCAPGVYLVDEASCCTQSLWSIASDGTMHTTSSAQGALGFGEGYGRWRQTRGQQIESTVLDFTYSKNSTGGGFSAAAIARVDAKSTFSDHCKELRGSFELRFFDSGTEDPLDPSTDTGAPLADTFTGRRITVP
jgi:hypothetical protein